MINPMYLSNKHFIITGASSGIGRACAIQASRLGAKVTIIARNEDKLLKTVNLMEDQDKHAYYCFDLNNTEDIETLPGGVIKSSRIGHPAKVIADYAREIGADLIVMGARGLSALKNLYLGSVSLGTIAKASCPVLVCREHYTPRNENLKIGIAVDGSGFGERCAKFVAHNKELFGENASARRKT